jgi:hypothetical protein
MPENPYPAGSARAKLWARREAEKANKTAAAKPKQSIDNTVREELERRPQYIKQRKNNQSTDSNN